MAEDSDWIDDVLRADRATPVRDDGFVQRLLTDLPARRAGRRVWITPLMTAAGTILAVLSLGVLQPPFPCCSIPRSQAPSRSLCCCPSSSCWAAPSGQSLNPDDAAALTPDGLLHAAGGSA